MRRVPWWVALAVIVSALPGAAFPTLLAMCPAGADDGPAGMVRTLVWCYPFYVIFSAWAAWAAWRERPWLTWVLVALMWLTHAAVWSLVLEFRG